MDVLFDRSALRNRFLTGAALFRSGSGGATILGGEPQNEERVQPSETSEHQTGRLAATRRGAGGSGAPILRGRPRQRDGSNPLRDMRNTSPRFLAKAGNQPISRSLAWLHGGRSLCSVKRESAGSTGLWSEQRWAVRARTGEDAGPPQPGVFGSSGNSGMTMPRKPSDVWRRLPAGQYVAPASSRWWQVDNMLGRAGFSRAFRTRKLGKADRSPHRQDADATGMPAPQDAKVGGRRWSTRADLRQARPSRNSRMNRMFEIDGKPAYRTQVPFGSRFNPLIAGKVSILPMKSCILSVSSVLARRQGSIGYQPTLVWRAHRALC